MTRTRFLDFPAPDSTRLLNDRFRGILQAGVYLGFNTVPGTSGLSVSLTMDTDPDNTGLLLGSLITHDGVVIQEDATLTDVATATTADPTLDRIDLLVATYIYNASLPNNDVTYEIIAGTPSASPVAPALSNNQVFISQLQITAALATITSTLIMDANRKNLFSNQPLDLENILRNGIYTGFTLKEGTAVNDVTITAGTLFTPEEKRIEETSDQTDVFTFTDTTSSSHYRYD